MKKSLRQNNPEAGFYLPYVVFISMIIFTILASSVAIYQNNLEATHKMMELTKVDTLVQMTKAEFKNDELYKTEQKGEIRYEYPDGKVHVTYKPEDENSWELYVRIVTKNNFIFEDFYSVIVD